jgi:hypothetical protein
LETLVGAFGAAVGATLGMAEPPMGAAVGATVGMAEPPVGAAVGGMTGERVGVVVGAAVVGATVGMADGAIVCGMTGERVGVVVGAEDETVGMMVGKPVVLGALVDDVGAVGASVCGHI